MAQNNCRGCPNRVGPTGGAYAEDCAVFSDPTVKRWFIQALLSSPERACPGRQDASAGDAP